MKLTALVVAILALGIVVGFALAGGASKGPASAAPQCPGPSSQCPTPTPTPPQQREDQITIFAEAQIPGASARFAEEAGWFAHFLTPGVIIDTADYPADATFRFEGVAYRAICMRLFEFTGISGVSPSTVLGPVVPGSEVCSQRDGLPFRSGPIQMPAGEHNYSAQFDELDTERVVAARVIVEWTE